MVGPICLITLDNHGTYRGWRAAVASGRIACMTTLSVEEALQVVEEKAAMLGYLARTAATTPETMERAALNGVSEVCADMERLTRRSRRALSVEALSTELGRVPQKGS